MVIVSKPSPIITAPASAVNQANKSSSQQQQQPPLIVFDLGQQHQQQQQQQLQNQQTVAKECESDVKNNVLSDILKSTGIIETDMAASTMEETEASSTPPPLRSAAADHARGTYSETKLSDRCQDKSLEYLQTRPRCS